MKKIKQFFLMAAMFAGIAFGTTEARAEETPTILQGISIDSVDVSGMTADQAKEAVSQFLTERLDDEITFHMNGNTYSSTVEALGYSWANQEVVDEALNYGKDGNLIKKYTQKKDLEYFPVSLEMKTAVDDNAVIDILENGCSQYNQPVVEYGLATENGAVVIVGGKTGVTLDVEASKEAVRDFITTQWAGGSGDVDLIVVTQDPKDVKADLEKVTDVLGAGSTSYASSSSNRKTNIENGTKKINGIILYPGESFSMLDICTPFTEKNGYLPAGSFESGAVVDSLGGGICQVSTTLYLAVIRSELQIDQRHSHSMRVTYVKPSFDAAIAEGSKDFKFTNNTDAPIYIEGTTNGKEVAFTVYGQDNRDPDRKVEYVSETLSNSNPKVDMKAMLWKIVTIDGEETKTEFNHSTYYKKKEEKVVEDTSEESDEDESEDETE